MSYVNTTGTNIGNCLTGFGIHYPVTIYNSGNSEVIYNLNNSNTSNFDVSKSSFIISPSNYDVFDILYKPTISSPASDETTAITIQSISAEDGSVDPSGNITLNITGSKITDITGGNPRSFRVVSIFNGPEYNFYWKAPSGITGANLANYFITGYKLELSTSTNFGSPVFNKFINVGQNNNADPLFSTYYGFGDEDITYKLDRNEYSNLQTNSNYYARLYTLINGNSGASVYASGVNSVSQSVSEEVFIGYSGTPINIKIEKKTFDFYIDGSNYYNYTYDLFSKLVQQNNNSSDFSAYSGINIYLPENSLFESQDLSKGALDLNGTFLNLTGNPAGTFINIYVPSTTEIVGRIGDGTNIVWQNGWEQFYFNNPQGLIDAATISSPGYSDSTNGGPCFSLKATTNVNNAGNVNDIKYNIYSQLPNPEAGVSFLNGLVNSKSRIASGSGGGKGGFLYSPYFVNILAYLAYHDTIKTSNKLFYDVIPFNPPQTKNYLSNTRLNRNFLLWDVYYYVCSRIYYEVEIINGEQKATVPISANQYSAKLGVPYMQYGEIGAANLLVTYPDNSKKYTNNINITTTAGRNANAINDYPGPYRFVDYGEWLPINLNYNDRQPGYLVDSFSNASVVFSLYNKTLPSDHVFRFKNTGLVSAAAWNDTTSTYQLANSNVSSQGSFTNNYQNLGASSFKSINFKNNQYLEINFTATNIVKDFDLFLVCSFDDFSISNTDTLLYASLFDWNYNDANSNTNINTNQFAIRKYDPLDYASYPKEDLSFYYSNPCLNNRKDNSQSSIFSEKISKQLYSLLQISSISSNTITTTTNHGLSNGDTIGFTGDGLPSQITTYDTVSPYTRKIYYVKNATSNTFKISETSGGADVTLSSGTGTVHKITSQSLYRPFILNIRRSGLVYYYYINKKFIGKTNFITNPFMITDLKDTKLKLINRNSSLGINYFDFTFYKRLLSDSELQSAYSALVDEYFSLFTGETNTSSINLKSNLYSFRLPNIFNIAGRS